MGGTFDPIHYGHLVTAEEALVQFNLDRVVFMPTGHPVAKSHAEVTFNVVPTGKQLELTAVAYCTKHGLWECDPVTVTVEE